MQNCTLIEFWRIWSLINKKWNTLAEELSIHLSPEMEQITRLNRNNFGKMLKIIWIDKYVIYLKVFKFIKEVREYV